MAIITRRIVNRISFSDRVAARRCNPGRGDRLQLVDHVQSLHELDGQFPAATY
jgi:hypothetical protein